MNEAIVGTFLWKSSFIKMLKLSLIRMIIGLWKLNEQSVSSIIERGEYFALKFTLTLNNFHVE